MIMYGNGFGVGFVGGSHGVISEASFPMSVMVFSFFSCKSGSGALALRKWACSRAGRTGFISVVLIMSHIARSTPQQDNIRCS
jgi:hypothetical protein